MTSKSQASTFLAILLCLFVGGLGLTRGQDAVTKEKPAGEATPAEDAKLADKPDAKEAEKPADAPKPGDDKPAEPEMEPEEDDPKKLEKEEEAAAIALPVSPDPVQIYGWKEWVFLNDGKADMKMAAKFDTGAYTSSIHAEEKKLFERDGKKWVRFVVTDPSEKDFPRIRVEAPLVRIARVKEPGGNSEEREVVRLAFRVGDRKLKADFTLSNRSNMLNPMLIGRTTIRELGWVDPSRAFIADKKLMR
ncbi:ATP-dependent zinc protease [Haloferula helveola]|uniref:ATP-dependent zinc protease family protein n=1 Tax=Haloferula helveola TaxID=490095 RepID=UPI00309ED8E1